MSAEKPVLRAAIEKADSDAKKLGVKPKTKGNKK